MLLALAAYLAGTATCLLVLAVLDFLGLVPGLDSATARRERGGSPLWFNCFSAPFFDSHFLRRAPVGAWPQTGDARVQRKCFTLLCASPASLLAATARVFRFDRRQRSGTNHDA